MFRTKWRLSILYPPVFLDRRSENERPCKVWTGGPQISDFRLNCARLADNNVTGTDSRESLVSSSLRSKESGFEERDWVAVRSRGIFTIKELVMKLKYSAEEIK